MFIILVKMEKKFFITQKIPLNPPLPKGDFIPLFSALRRIRRGEGKVGATLR